ncbi:MAG: fumarylacetoacetate hydrolase family protein [Candidatus Nitrohelix vancouverensis]|uniref:Fumarylacetoacetate hydrolase family protein n=1 Tax=Candidatus Nitrohelix vancouverensis TaxID=2705534 RepID=A0A7T0G4U7_9BACT|nr:MAG: fumarylacetoacetate hydrolase family protein [Candidatus Nitrohelix vancouverensis]
MTPKRIFCIGKNYEAHVRELAGTAPEEPIVFMKPSSCLVLPGTPVRVPTHGSLLHHEAEAVLLIGREASRVDEESALDCVSDVALGLDLTLRDVQGSLKKKGHPWELSKAFEQSAPLGPLVPVSKIRDLAQLEFSCSVNGELRQQGNTQDMMFSIPYLIRYLSHIWRLQAGDLIFTGTPAGVGPLVVGDTASLSGPELASSVWEFC